jgi:hypothetical protein
MSQLPEGGAAGAPQYYQWIFQWSFAATACTIVSGAIAERTRFEAYFFYSFFMAAWVYPIIVHSVWSVNGWANMNRANGPLLFQRGVIDFAGSGAVHMVGGEETVPGTLFSEPFWGGSLSFFHRKGKNSPLFLPLFFKKKTKTKTKKASPPPRAPSSSARASAASCPTARSCRCRDTTRACSSSE